MHLRDRPNLTAFAALLCLATAPIHARAQTGMPGGGGGSAPAHMAAYYAYMLEEIQEVTDAFEEAWAAEDDEGLLEVFHEESALVLDGEFRIRGREQVVERLREIWPRRWAVRLTIVDFEASGEMAMIYGQLGDAPGQHVTLVKRFGRDWYIVRQFLTGAAPETVADGNPDGG